MSLTKINLWEVVKKQLRFKMKSYRGMFTTLMMLQLLALLFSLGGEGGGGGGSDTFSYSLNSYTGNMLLAFMMIWAFISAILITTQAYRFDDYTFVANRLSSHLSNILFLGLASVVGGITFLLASRSLKLFVVLVKNSENTIIAPLNTQQMLAGVAATILYIFLFTAFGYLVGTIVQKSKLFIIILPAAFFGTLFLDASISGESTLLVNAGLFFGGETSFFLFVLKVLLISGLTFGTAVLISDRMEVRT